MDVWIRWLGEVFWRITKVAPSKEHLTADPKNEEFWFRSYGVLMLVAGLAIGVWLGGRRGGFLSNLAAMASNYPGADKSFAQPYIGAVLVLMVGLGPPSSSSPWWPWWSVSWSTW